MNVRPIRAVELTPSARVAIAKKKLADAIDELLDAKLAEKNSSSEWVSQDNSPLGKNRHLRLVRKNILPAVKDGKKRLVRKCDIDAYLEKHPVVINTPPNQFTQAELEEIMDVGGIKK